MKLTSSFARTLFLQIDADGLPLLIGPPASATSTAPRAFVEEMLEKKSVVAHALMCPMLGSEHDVAMELAPAIAHARATPDQWSVLVVDHVDRATAAVTNAVLTLVKQRWITDAALPENLRMVVLASGAGHTGVIDQLVGLGASRHDVEDTIETGSIELALAGGEISTVLYALGHATGAGTSEHASLATRVETAPRDPDTFHLSLSVPLLVDEIPVVEKALREIAEMFRSSASPDMARIYEHVLTKIADAPRR